MKKIIQLFGEPCICTPLHFNAGLEKNAPCRVKPFLKLITLLVYVVYLVYFYYRPAPVVRAGCLNTRTRYAVVRIGTRYLHRGGTIPLKGALWGMYKFTIRPEGNTPCLGMPRERSFGVVNRRPVTRLNFLSLSNPQFSSGSLKVSPLMVPFLQSTY